MTPQLVFNGWSTSIWWSATLIGAAVASAVVVALLYRYERRLVPWHVGALLLALRLAVVTLLFITLFEPVLNWTRDQKQRGRIVVAVDVSESMSTADSQATPAEKLRWARGLGMIGNSTVADRLDRWQAALDSDQVPPWLDPGEGGDAPSSSRLATSRQENLESVLVAVGMLSRKEIALRLLSGGSRPLLPELDSLGYLELHVFAGKSAAADAQRLAKLVAEPGESLQIQRTDLNQALTPAVAGADSVPVLGVVLLTDGRDNSGGDPSGLAGRLKAASTPLYPVLLGSRRRPKDLAIADLDYPQAAFKGDHPLLKARISTAGFEEQPLTVTLERAGAEPVTRTVTPHGPTAEVEFPLDAETAGHREYIVRTEPQPGETRDDNNQKSFAMTVADDKVRVRLLEGEARWEFRFIDNALRRDERVEIQPVVFSQPYLGQMPETFFPRRLNLPADAENLENSPFAEADLVIIGDIDPADLPAVGWQLLDKFVAEGGGTVVFVAGKRHLPFGYRSEILDRLLPVTGLQEVRLDGPAAKAPPSQRGFRLRLTPEGESEPMFKFNVDPLQNRGIWAALPGHVWGMIGAAKPGATVFASAYQPGEAPDLEAERKQAVIVHQHYGLGQVLWLGIDSTWRWRYRVGDQYHHRFWGQLGRWAANNKAAAGNSFVKFGPERADLQQGEDAIIWARWTSSFLRGFPQLKAKAELFRAGAADGSQPFTTIDLVPSESRPLVYEGRAAALPAGEYRVQLVVSGAELGAEEIAANLYVQAPATLELSDLSANADLLKQLADASGGQVFLPHEVQDIPPLFQDPQHTTARREETLLWNHGLWLTLFLGLLMCEWVLRKLNGLP